MKKRKRNLTPQEFKKIYSKVPRITVEVVAIYNSKIALIKRQEDSWHGQIHIPGGSVLYQETLIDAVKRNAKEELGVDVEVRKQIGYIEYPSEIKERGFGWSIGITFLCNITSAIDFELWKKDDIKLYDHLPNNLIVEQIETLQSVFDSFNN
jgi:ADP-ribose pyrophosphatase YjhB (NUDIX family)